MLHERRYHHMYRTRNTDYFLRSNECVGVRERDTGRWVRNHTALRMFALEVPDLGHADRRCDANTWIGRRLEFFGRGEDLVTSPIEAIQRPPLHTVVHYVSHARSGTIVAAHP